METVLEFAVFCFAMLGMGFMSLLMIDMGRSIISGWRKEAERRRIQASIEAFERERRAEKKVQG